MGKIWTVFSDLMTPDNQAGDWYGWATNQLSHAMLGVVAGGLAVALGFSFSLTLAFVAAVVVTKELGDLARGADIWDSANDAAFQLIGVAFAGSLYLHSFIGMSVSAAVGIGLLAYGIFTRVSHGQDIGRE